MIWTIMVIGGIGTFALRLSFIELVDRFEMPALLRDALRFVPPAVLAALVVPAIVHGGGGLVVDNYRIPAALVALGLALWRGNVLLTLAGGMATLWLLSWWLG